MVATGSKRTKRVCKLKQGGKTYEVEPLSDDVLVEELYDYRLPRKHEGTGVNGTSEPYRVRGRGFEPPNPYGSGS